MDINIEDLKNRFKIFQDHKTDKTKSSCIFNISHPNVKNIDYLEFIENGELTIYSNGIAYPLFKPENNPGEEMYNCRLEVDNVVGPKIVDGNNNLVWGMMTHDTSFSKAPLKQNDKEQMKAVLSQMYFNRLAEKLSGDIIIADENGILKNNNNIDLDYDILYGPSSKNNGYYIKTSTRYGKEPSKLKFGNLQLTLYKDKLSFEGLSSYTGKLITIWEFEFSWKTLLRSDKDSPEYFVVLYQRMHGNGNNQNVDYNIDRTDGDLYVTLVENDDVITFNNEYKEIDGNEMETISLSNAFNFPKIKGASFSFDNTGPSMRYANLLVWHPLFGLSKDQILDYFDKYCHVGYLMTDSTNVREFDLDYINNIEPFSNKNKNKMKIKIKIKINILEKSLIQIQIHTPNLSIHRH